MRCPIATTIMTPIPVAITVTPTQDDLSTINQVQAGPVGHPHLHLQVMWPPPQTVGLWFILMAAALRMVEMVPGLALVFIGALTIPGTSYM